MSPHLYARFPTRFDLSKIANAVQYLLHTLSAALGIANLKRVMCFVQRNLAAPYPTAHHAHWKPCAFFIRPINNSNRALRLNPVLLQNAQHLNSSTDTEDAVETAARGLRVEMRTSESCRLGVVESRTKVGSCKC